MVNKELSKGSTAILILSLLSGEDMYGYQMTKELSRRSNDVFNLKEGTLYPLLHTLENDGMITSYWEDAAAARKRKYYHLTEAGRKFLSAKETEWRIFSQAVDRVIGGDSLECLC